MRVFYLVIVVVLFGIVSVYSPKRLFPVSVPSVILSGQVLLFSAARLVRVSSAQLDFLLLFQRCSERLYTCVFVSSLKL